jgi:low temperature requirement protein LtrA
VSAGAGGAAGESESEAAPPDHAPPDHAPLEPDTDAPSLPLRVSTLEIFFDLVFAFSLTQLTALLAGHQTWRAAAQVLLVFGLLWWMYGAYAWLTNSRPPVHTAERLLLLVGMAGFLIIGLAIPRGFGRYGLVLGLGYLVVVLVHAVLYYRVNANILRVAPFNIASALLVTLAGLPPGQHDGRTGAAGYALWVAALAVQLGSPLIVHPKNFFELRPDHFTERHSALLIVAIGESVAAVGIGAAGPASRSGPVSWHLLASAVLGLAVAAALWWTAFGSGDDERGERALTEATGERRTALALNAYFYGNIPLLLGLIAMAAGVLRAVVLTGGAAGPGPGPASRVWPAAVLAAGAALFLTGDAIIRRQLRTGPAGLRGWAAAAALATIPAGVFAGLNVQLLLVVAVLAGPVVAESRARPQDPAGAAGAAAGGAPGGAAEGGAAG